MRRAGWWAAGLGLFVLSAAASGVLADEPTAPTPPSLAPDDPSVPPPEPQPDQPDPQPGAQSQADALGRDVERAYNNTQTTAANVQGTAQDAQEDARAAQDDAQDTQEAAQARLEEAGGDEGPVNRLSGRIDKVIEDLNPAPNPSFFAAGRPASGGGDAAAAVAGAPDAWVSLVAAGAMGSALLGALIASRTLRTLLLLPLLSRISRSQIFDNEARRLVAQLVDATPGLCLNDMVARTGYSRNAVSYHLFVLEKEEELVSIKDGKYRRYFPRGGRYVNGAKNVVSALRNPVTLRMAQHVVSNPGSIQRDLCRVLATTPSAACWHAKRLEALGVVRKERVSNTVQYYPGPALAKYDLTDFGLAGFVATGTPTQTVAVASPLVL